MEDNKKTPEEFQKEAALNLSAVNNSKIEAEKAAEAAGVAIAGQKKEEERLAIAQTRRKDLKSEVSKLEDNRDTTLAEATAAAEDLKGLNKEKDAVGEQLTSAQEYLTDLEQAVTDETDNFKKGVRAFTAQKAENEAEIKKQKEALKKSVLQGDAKIEVLNNAISDAEEVQRVAEEAATKAQSALNKIEGKMEALGIEIEEMEEKKVTLSGEIEALEKAEEVAKTATIAAEKELSEASGRIKELTDEKFKLAARSTKLDEREALVREAFIVAGVEYPTN